MLTPRRTTPSDRKRSKAGIDLAKEILKAVYQYEALLGRLTRLAKASEPK
jgi:hypothetical protein